MKSHPDPLLRRCRLGVRERRSPRRNGLGCLTWYDDCWARWCQFWVSAKSRDARRRCLCCNRGPGRPTSGITMASATKRLTLKGRFPSQDRSASVRSMHSSPPTPRISAYCETVRRLSHPVTTPSCPRSTCGGGEFSLRPLDPQDCGLPPRSVVSIMRATATKAQAGDCADARLRCHVLRNDVRLLDTHMKIMS